MSNILAFIIDFLLFKYNEISILFNGFITHPRQFITILIEMSLESDNKNKIIIRKIKFIKLYLKKSNTKS